MPNDRVTSIYVMAPLGDTCIYFQRTRPDHSVRNVKEYKTRKISDYSLTRINAILRRFARTTPIISRHNPCIGFHGFDMRAPR